MSVVPSAPRARTGRPAHRRHAHADAADAERSPDQAHQVGVDANLLPDAAHAHEHARSLRLRFNGNCCCASQVRLSRLPLLGILSLTCSSRAPRRPRPAHTAPQVAQQHITGADQQHRPKRHRNQPQTPPHSHGSTPRFASSHRPPRAMRTNALSQVLLVQFQRRSARTWPSSAVPTARQDQQRNIARRAAAARGERQHHHRMRTNAGSQLTYSRPGCRTRP